MTLNELQRAAVVLFAAREVGADGSVDQMRAVCQVLRNRVQADWHSDYMQTMEAWESGEGQANPPQQRAALMLSDRRLAMLAREIDEIFYGQAGDEVAQCCGRQDKERGPLLYWAFVDRKVLPAFVENVVRRPNEHRQRYQVGNTMYLYE
jgi:hypothetical protein